MAYLRYTLKVGKWTLSQQRIEAILQIPIPTTKRQVREFLGAVGCYRLWIPGFSEIAKPLYLATGGNHPLHWTETEQKAFDFLKQALISAPALAFPGITKGFHLFVSENKGIAKGVLTQTLGPWCQPVAYKRD